MAAKAGAALAKGVEELLTCAICHEEYDDPRVMPCLHSFCCRCLQRLHSAVAPPPPPGMAAAPAREAVVLPVSTAISCPTCRRVFDMTPEDIQGLMCNFLLNSLKDAQALSRRAARGGGGGGGAGPTAVDIMQCNVCEASPAAHRCVDCRQYLCEEDAAAHRRGVKTKGHSVRSLGDIAAGGTASATLCKRAIECAKHADTPLNLFCKTCSVAICHMCAVTSTGHAGHTVDELRSCVGVLRTSLSAAIAAVKHEDGASAAFTASIERKRLEVVAACDAQLAETRTWHALLARSLDEKKAGYDAASRAKLAEQTAALAAQLKDGQLHFASVASSVAFARTTLETGDDVEIGVAHTTICAGLKAAAAELAASNRIPTCPAALVHARVSADDFSASLAGGIQVSRTGTGPD